jgi:putative membrane protein
MYYENYNFVGMHFGWWIFWGLLIFWIFATPYDIPTTLQEKFTNSTVKKKIGLWRN